MTARRDLDAIIAAWLDEGPSELPEQTRRAIAVTTRTTDQKRRSPWAPWRTTLMPSLLRVALAAIAVIAVAGGAVYFLRPGQGVGVALPTPAASASSAPPSLVPPSPEALGTVPINWTTFVSSRFAYTIDYPADWGITPATSDWPPIGFPEDASFDNLGPRPFGIQVVLSSVALTAEKDATEWTTELDQLNAGLCTQVSDRHNITLDGVTARQEELVCIQTYHIIEVAVAGGGRYYLIRLYSAGPPLTATDRSTFDKILTSFRLGA